MNYRFIAIEGNIGAGKSVLSTRLAKDFKAKLILEEFKENSFLPKFYQDQERYAFPLEMSFLADRFNQLKKLVFDQDIFQQAIIADYVFLKCAVFSRITLNDDEFELYQRLFQIIQAQLPLPDLLVYLHTPIPKLQFQIKMRGRSYEQDIADDYLLKLQEGYLEMLHKQPGLRVVMIDMTQVDFVSQEAHYLKIKDLLQESYPLGVTKLSIID